METYKGKKKRKPQQESSGNSKENNRSCCRKKRGKKKREQARRRIYRQKQKLQDTPEHKVPQAAIRRIRQEGILFCTAKFQRRNRRMLLLRGHTKQSREWKECLFFCEKRRYGGRKARKQKKLAKQEKNWSRKRFSFSMKSS